MNWFGSRTTTSYESGSLEDVQLVENALRSGHAFEPIVRKYHAMVFAIALAHLRDSESAEDLAQEVFVRAFLHLQTLKEPRTLAAWLGRIARNQSLKWIEKHQNRSRLLPLIPLDLVPAEQPDPSASSPREIAAAHSEWQTVMRAVDSLPAHQREMVWMHYLEGIGKSDIARRLELHPSSIGRQLDNALQRLRTQLGGSEATVRRAAPTLTPARTVALVPVLVGLSAASRAALLQASADTMGLAAAGTLAHTPVASVSKAAAVVAHVPAVAVATSAAVVVLTAGVLWKPLTSTRRDHATPPSYATENRTDQPNAHVSSTSASSGPVATRPIAQVSSTRRVVPKATSASVLQSASLGKPGDEATTQPDFILGQVVDADGHPIEGALVDTDLNHSGDEVYTNGQGYFRIGDLSPKYPTEFRISKDGYSPYYKFAQPLGVYHEPFVLGSKTYLEGKVTTPDGGPAAGALVRADLGPQMKGGYGTDHVWFEIYANAEGNYRLFLQPGKYIVTSRLDANTALMPDVSLAADESKHLDIQLQRGRMLRLQLLDSLTSAPVQGVKLSDWRQPSLQGTSDANGVIAFPGLTPGKMELQVEAEKYARWWLGPQSSDVRRRIRDQSSFDSTARFQRDFDGLQFELSDELTSHIVILEPAAIIRGHVLDPEENPVQGATVAPALTGTGNSITGDTRFSVHTDKSGAFEAKLPASFEDNYNLVAHDGKYGENRTWANGMSPVVHTWPGDEINTCTIHLTRGASVEGEVVDSNGQPIGGKRVEATPADATGNRYYLPFTTTGADGKFALKMVPPGPEYIMVGDHSAVPGYFYTTKGSYVKLDLGHGETTSGIRLVVEKDPLALPRKPSANTSTSTDRDERIEQHRKRIEDIIAQNRAMAAKQGAPGGTSATSATTDRLTISVVLRDQTTGTAPQNITIVSAGFAMGRITEKLSEVSDLPVVATGAAAQIRVPSYVVRNVSLPEALDQLVKSVPGIAWRKAHLGPVSMYEIYPVDSPSLEAGEATTLIVSGTPLTVRFYGPLEIVLTRLSAAANLQVISQLSLASNVNVRFDVQNKPIEAVLYVLAAQIPGATVVKTEETVSGQKLVTGYELRDMKDIPGNSSTTRTTGTSPVRKSELREFESRLPQTNVKDTLGQELPSTGVASATVASGPAQKGQYELAGRVFVENSTAIPGTQVNLILWHSTTASAGTASDLPNQEHIMARVEADGTFKFEGLRPGAGILWLRTSPHEATGLVTPVVAVQIPSPTSIDLRYTSGPGATITGVVDPATANGAHQRLVYVLALRQVELLNPGDSTAQTITVSVPVQSVPINSDGTFRAGALPPGELEVRTSLTSREPGTFQRLNLASGETATVQLK